MWSKIISVAGYTLLILRTVLESCEKIQFACGPSSYMDPTPGNHECQFVGILNRDY